MSSRHLVFRGHLVYLCHFWDCLLAPVPRYWSKSGKESFWFPDCWSNLLHSNFAWVKNQTYSKKTWAKDLKEQMIKRDKKYLDNEIMPAIYKVMFAFFFFFLNLMPSGSQNLARYHMDHKVSYFSNVTQNLSINVFEFCSYSGKKWYFSGEKRRHR